jgi:hypothetical protein
MIVNSTALCTKKTYLSASSTASKRKILYSAALWVGFQLSFIEVLTLDGKVQGIQRSFELLMEQKAPITNFHLIVHI